MEPDKITAAAAELLEQQKRERLAVIHRLADGQQSEDELLAQLAEVRQNYARDWAEAQRLGWSPKELRRLKLRPPERSAARPSRAGKNATSSGNGTADDTPGRRAADAAATHFSGPLGGEQSPEQSPAQSTTAEPASTS